nr:YdhK family protein [Ectobacillus panaciterrae]
MVACSTATKENDQSSMDNMKQGNMSNMNHSSSGEIPKRLKEEKNPTYKVGSEVIVKADHMEGMNGAKATVVGAYDTTAYAVSYTPTTGGAKVTNHKWVIQEEIKNADNETLKPGTEVTLEADHMKGMMSTKGTIDLAEKTTVYMIDYTPTTGGEKVTNHKWVTESELSTK